MLMLYAKHGEIQEAIKLSRPAARTAENKSEGLKGEAEERKDVWETKGGCGGWGGVDWMSSPQACG